MQSLSGAWSARAPAIRAAIGADDRTWGAINAVPVVGDVLALFVVFFLVGRVSTRLLALVGACLVLINAPIAAFAPSLAGVAIGLIAWIFGSSLLSTPMDALQIERCSAGTGGR